MHLKLFKRAVALQKKAKEWKSIRRVMEKRVSSTSHGRIYHFGIGKRDGI